MKKNYLLFVFMLFLILLSVFAACNGPGDSSKGDTPEGETHHSYKETMVSVDLITPADRIVILQNVFNPNAREGFYTRETMPAAEVITYSGGNAEAFPISHAIDLLHKGCEGKVAVVKTDGGRTEFSVEDFRGMYVMFDLKSETPPILHNPATKSTATDFAYAVTGAGEVIYSVVSGSYHNIKELLTKAGWDTGATYRFVATDKFHLPVEPGAIAAGELRGALSGTVNGSFPDLSLANGKINDVLYIELIEPAEL